MTRYLLLNLVFTAAIFIILNLLAKLRLNRPLAKTIFLMLALTAIFDSLIVGSGIVGYNLENILGVYVIKAPIEDFFYAIVSVLLMVTLWEHYDKET